MTKHPLKTEKGLVKKLRSIRDNINLDIQHMTLQEEKEYLNQLVAGWKHAPQYPHNQPA